MQAEEKAMWRQEAEIGVTQTEGMLTATKGYQKLEEVGKEPSLETHSADTLISDFCLLICERRFFVFFVLFLFYFLIAQFIL